MTQIPDQALFGQKLGEPGAAPPGAAGGLELHFGIGGSLEGYFDELYSLHAGGLFGIGDEMGTAFGDAFGTIFGMDAGKPGAPFVDGYGPLNEAANDDLPAG